MSIQYYWRKFWPWALLVQLWSMLVQYPLKEFCSTFGCTQDTTQKTFAFYWLDLFKHTSFDLKQSNMMMMMMMYSYSVVILAESRPIRTRTIYFILHGKPFYTGVKTMYRDTQRWERDARPSARIVGPLKNNREKELSYCWYSSCTARENWVKVLDFISQAVSNFSNLGDLVSIW